MIRIAIVVIYLCFYIASTYILIGATVDRGVNRNGKKDGAVMIESSGWNANLVIVLPRQAPVHNSYYSALYFMLVH
jgi:hypothetical protein